MTRRSNGQGHTYKVGTSFRTVIHSNGTVVTAMAKNAQDSRKLAFLGTICMLIDLNSVKSVRLKNRTL